ncbi:MAG TPA: DUF4296 domain-containing protein [Bacteroidales bacterium]|nr:DUF4296 domain-containing protein [Bacteroidales bacterium]
MKRFMSRFKLFTFILLLVTTASCSSRKNKLDRSSLIPEQDMISIIKDIYLANGLLNLPDVHHWYVPPDSLSTYRDVIGKYGYTKDAMDRTLKFYFVKDPKELVKIYDQVLGQLSALDSRVEKALNQEEAKAANYWKGDDPVLYPAMDKGDSSYFSIIIKPGLYTFTYTMTLYPDDCSFNPRLSLWYFNRDSAGTGKRYFIPTLHYVKDGLPHTYVNKIIIPGKPFVILRGHIYNYDNYPASFHKHLRIEKITFLHTTN